ncbi:hypothetical protein FO519_008115 [Halicephalobus sp. NKZ332]|nr:hypothetical protein FO519_008115 [Halicephalobus sp. NKZ332]
MTERVPIEENISAAKLGEELFFPTAKRTARNRFMKAALTERVSTYVDGDIGKSGLPTKELCNMYEKYSHGGFGMLLTGNIIVDPIHLESAGNAIIHKSVDSRERRSAFGDLAKAMKAVPEVLAIAQLSNAGRQTPVTLCKNPISASEVQLKTVRRGTGFGVPKSLSVDEIKEQVIPDFVFAAKFCYEVGFDGIQLHCAHGYLLAQFISLTTNERTDEYGGSAFNRCRLILEIYEAIRKEIPPETGFLIGIKMNSVEFQEKGLDSDDSVLMCKEFEKIGFDFIELSGGTIEKLVFCHISESTVKREAFFLEFAKKIRPAIKNTVVYLTGGFRTVPGMVKAVEEGATDGIGLGRPITAELDLPKKILAGEVQSSITNPFDQDFAVSNMLSNLQMWQSQQKNMNEISHINEGILDISDEDQKVKFQKTLQIYLQEIAKIAAEGKPIHGTIQLEI